MTPFSEPEQNWLLPAARHHLASVVVAGRFLPIWLATGVLMLVAAIIAPRALENTSWAYVLPYMAVLAVTALGQMLVIMHAGIDLSTPGVMSFAGNLIVGVSLGQDGRLRPTAETRLRAARMAVTRWPGRATPGAGSDSLAEYEHAHSYWRGAG